MSEEGLRTRCLIDLNAVAYNLGQIRRKIGPKRFITAVIKADAYGHGMYEVAQTLSQYNNLYFAVVTPDEGIRLRKSQPEIPILLLSCLLPNELDAVVESNCIPSIAHLETAEKLNDLGKKLKRKFPVHVETDTGIGRIGPYYTEAAEFIEKLSAYDHLVVEGLFTHFSGSDDDEPFTLEQIKRFNQVSQKLEEKKISIRFRHTANSAAVLKYPQAYYEMVRPGLILYGLYPNESMIQDISLKQAMTIVSKIVHLRQVPSGYTVSYGRTYVTSKPTLIGVVNVGYRNGYDRLCSNKGEALVHGKRVPIIGRVCMDQLMLDVTDIPGIKMEDEVIFAGRQGEGFISLADIARWSSTINYETACTLGSMTKRFYTR